MNLRHNRLLTTLALLGAPMLACTRVASGLEGLFFRIGLVFYGVLGVLGLWAVIATIRGPRFGVPTLVISMLFGGIVVFLTGEQTEGFAPWPGTLALDTMILMWLPQPLAVLAPVTAARFAADRTRHARLAWSVAIAVIAGYLGLLTFASTRVIEPPIDGRIIEVAVTDEHAYARTDTGALVLMPGLALPGKYRAVHAGTDLALAIDEQGRVLRLAGRDLPVALPVAAPVRDVAVAGTRACVADTRGAVDCLDVADEANTGPAALKPMPELGDVVDLEIGAGLTCAIDGQARVTCRGSANLRGLAEGPQLLGEPGARGLAVTASAVCVLAAAGIVACAGDNEWRALGQPGEAPEHSATLLPVPGLTAVEQLVAGDYHLCARDSAGAVRCWGGNGWNQLGPESLGDRRGEPVVIPLPAAATTLVAERTSTCATLGDGRLFCWGAQRDDGAVFYSRSCGRLLGPRIDCTDYPIDIHLPTTAIPFRSRTAAR